MAVATDVARAGEALETATLATVDPEHAGMRSVVLVAGDTGGWAGPWLVADAAGAS